MHGSVYTVNMSPMVQLSPDAYARLRNAKRPEESFSDVVLRLTRPKRKGKDPWDALADASKDVDWDAYEKIRKELKELDMRSAWDDV